jgi:UDP-GlcNAc:undecaprenyl-phosphate GlcNAc-1-phosphate transferase
MHIRFLIVSLTLIFFGSLLLSLAIMPIVIRLLKKFHILDFPNYRKIHTKPIPRMAGVSIYFAFIIPLSIYFYCYNIEISGPWTGILIGSTFAMLIGCADDIWNVPAVIKLICLFLLTIIIWRFGVITNLPLENFLGIDNNKYIHIAGNLSITMLWLVGITSALNALDHMDGMAGTISIVAAISYFFVSVQTGQNTWALISMGLIGSILGFLRYNWHPAKVFMGDSGSFFLGFCLASISILGGWSSNPLKASIIPIAIMSIPICDLFYVIITRRIKGVTHSIVESITYCGKDHIGHRLSKLGFSQAKAVIFVCLLSGSISISALIIRHVHYFESALLLIQIVMLYLTITFFMEVILNSKKNK